jgi:hypothetical protein
MKLIVLTVLSLLMLTAATAQPIDVSTYQQQFQLPITTKTSAIKIDGELNETAWLIKETASNFWMKFPTDNGHAPKNIEVKVCYDNEFIYFAAKIEEKKPYIGQSLKRDSRIRESDGLGIVLDPINKKTNGYYFSVTAYNVQADDVMSGGDDDLTFSWDTKWLSATKMYADYFTVEIAIPLKVLRYEANNTTWGINFIHSDKKANEFHTWTRIPVNFRGTDMGYLGALKWDKAPPPTGKNIVAIPYINQSFNHSNINNSPTQGKFNAGLDTRFALTHALNVDLTINPDFSQVDVDRQVTNLTRFNINFPERRNFFLENSDLYASYGIPPLRPFNSRAIGVDPDGNSVPIYAGLKLTGNVAAKTRVGILSMQTKATNTYAAQNYTAVSVQQQVLKRSVVKAYFLNREGFFTAKNKLTNALDAYGRNAGMEALYNSADGKYNAWLGLHHSIKPTITNLNNYLNYGAGYNSRKFSSFVNIDVAGANYYADMGYIERIALPYGKTDSLVRNGYKSAYTETSYTIFPKKRGNINQHKIALEASYITNPNNSFNENSNGLIYTMSMRNTSSFQVKQSYNAVQLNVPTLFTKEPLPVGKYSFAQSSIQYESDSRKKIVYGAGATIGNFYNGSFKRFSAKLIYRQQPKLTIELNAEYNDLQLPSAYGSSQLFLIAPRVEINFSTNLFWTTFIQYNTQANNVNFNSRLQWRYKPASDLFLVYTDNYFTDPLFKNKNRTIVLKVNYWLNL